MKDTDLVRVMRLMNEMVNNAQLEEQHKAIVIENEIILSEIFRKASDSLVDEFDALVESEATMDDFAATVTGALKSTFSSLGRFAKNKVSKLADKVNPTGREDSVVRDVVSSYTDELRLLKDKHEAALTLYTTEFWEDIFDMLGIKDSNESKEFLKTYKSNLIDLRNDAKKYKENIVEAIKQVNVEDGGKKVSITTRYKNMSSILASKYKDTVLKNPKVKEAMGLYKKFAAESFKKGFMSLFGQLVQAMTIRYMAMKNKNMSDDKGKNKGKKKTNESISFDQRFEMFEEQHAILKEYESK